MHSTVTTISTDDQILQDAYHQGFPESSPFPSDIRSAIFGTQSVLPIDDVLDNLDGYVVSNYQDRKLWRPVLRFLEAYDVAEQDFRENGNIERVAHYVDGFEKPYLFSDETYPN